MNHQTVATLYWIFWGISFYHLASFILLNVNLRWMRPKIQQKELSNNPSSYSNPSISVCIPARNEEKNIGACIDSILAFCSETTEIIVLDDHSEDETASIIRDRMTKSAQVKLINSKPLEEGWRGKNWACHQLGAHAKGEFIVFLDADVKITSPTFFEQEFFFRTKKNNSSISLLSLWPDQQLIGFWQKLIIPWVYKALLAHLPSNYQFRKPLLMPQVLYSKVKHWFGAANGQCMIFNSSAYKELGGHSVVKDEIVEDIAFSKIILKSGGATQIMMGHSLIQCSMYANEHEMWEGFRKNFFAGFNYSTIPFLTAGFFHLFFFVVPLFFLVHPVLALPSTAIIGLYILTDLRLRFAYKWPLRYACINYLGILWFSMLSLVCLTDYHLKRKVTWKGRSL